MYDLIWLLQQRLRAVSWPHWRLRCMLQPHCTATAWELSDLDHSHAATPQRVTRASCAQLLLLRSDFCAWRRLLLICWKLLIGVCVRDGLAASVCVYRTSAASVELRGWRAVAFPRWLHILSSKRFAVAHSHSHGSLLLRRLACTRQACCLFAHVALLLLPLSLFLGVRAPSRFPSVASGSKLLDVAHCLLLHQLFLLCFGFIGANTSSPGQEKLFIWPPFFQYNKRLLRQKMGGACLYMPQDSHWLASFEVIPPLKQLVFPRPK